MNGKNYQDVFYTGKLYFADSFLSEKLYVNIPKYINIRRKGKYRFRNSFTLFPSVFRICKVSMLNAPCPPEQLLFEGMIEGHGTVLITLNYNNQNPEPNQFSPVLVRKSFVYQFEP